jgi:hypothetical protein
MSYLNEEDLKILEKNFYFLKILKKSLYYVFYLSIDLNFEMIVVVLKYPKTQQ